MWQLLKVNSYREKLGRAESCSSKQRGENRKLPAAYAAMLCLSRNNEAGDASVRGLLQIVQAKASAVLAGAVPCSIIA